MNRGLRIAVIVLLAVAVLAPVGLVVYQSFLDGPFFQPTTAWTLSAYEFVFDDDDFYDALRNSAIVATGMTAIAVPIGALLAFLLVRTDLPGTRWLEPLILVPMFVSSVVLAFGFVVALGPVGIASLWVKGLVGTIPWNIYSLPSLVVIAGLTHVPHVFLYASSALRSLGSDVEEAARTAGAGPLRVALTVSLPMIAPALLYSGVLVFFLGFELFGLPLVLGDPEGILVLATYLYKLTNKLGTPSYQLMAVVVVVIIGISLPLVAMQRQLLKSANRYVSVKGKASGQRPVPIGPWRWPALALIGAWLSVSVIIPVTGLVLRSFLSNWGEGVSILDSLTTAHFRELLEFPNLVRGITNTLALAVFGGAASVAVYTVVNFAAHRWRSAWTFGLDYLVLLPRAMRGAGGGAGDLLGVPVHRTAAAVAADADRRVDRLYPCMARLRHAAGQQRAAADRAGARGGRAGGGGERRAGQPRFDAAADPRRADRQLGADLHHLRARVFDRRLSAQPRHRGDRLAARLVVGHGGDRPRHRLVHRQHRHDRLGAHPHDLLRETARMTAKLAVENLFLRYGPVEVLKGIDARFEEGSVVCLLGRSGSGKTTLLRAIAGLEEPSSGAIRLDGAAIYDGAAGVNLPPEKRGLGLVFQSYALWPHKTVAGNVAYGLKLRGQGGAEVGRRVQEVLDGVGLGALGERYPYQLSGGQQQRVALARALVYEPPVILLDEPLSNLDAKLREEARIWIRSLIKRLGLTAVFVTHDQVEAMAIADRIILLDQGRIVQDGTPQELYNDPASLFASEFMGSNNALVSKVLARDGGAAQIELAGVPLWGQDRGGTPIGQEATGVIRLEEVVFAPGRGENCIPVEHDTSVYLGGRFEHVFHAGPVQLRAYGPTPMAAGAHWLHLPEPRLWIF